MKKAVLFLAFCVAGLMSAASPSENEVVKVTAPQETKTIEQKLPPRSYQGFAAYDTSCCGTCFVYGTYTEYPEQGYWEFQSASLATQATVITPPCTGAGTYLG